MSVPRRALLSGFVLLLASCEDRRPEGVPPPSPPSPELRQQAEAGDAAAQFEFELAGDPEPFYWLVAPACQGHLEPRNLIMMHLAPSCFLSAREFPATAAGLLPGWVPLWARRALLTVVERGRLDATCVPPLNALRTTLGLPPVHSVMRRWLHSPDLTVGAFPDGFAAPQPDWPASAVVTGFPRLRAHAESPLPESATTDRLIAMVRRHREGEDWCVRANSRWNI